MDSTLCAYMAKNDGYEIIAVHFDYGQRTKKREKEAFNNICDKLEISKRHILKLDFFKDMGGSALTDESIEVPTNGIEDGVVPVTYVPFRNGIFLSIAGSIAEIENANAMFIGVVEEEFIESDIKQALKR